MLHGSIRSQKKISEDIIPTVNVHCLHFLERPDGEPAKHFIKDNCTRNNNAIVLSFDQSDSYK